MIEVRNFTGGLDYDDSLYDIPKGFYLDSLNITKDSVVANNDLAVTNVVGNVLVPYSLPSGTNVVIGAKSDTLRNRVFEFIWNSANYHSIVIFDETTRVRTKLIENLTDSNNEDVLQFTRYNKIIHADIIYRGEDEGDLLGWTDGNVSPRKINVKHIQNGIYTYLKVPFIELAKMPPISPITAVYGTDVTRNANSLRKKLIMATYRWCYDDYEKSTFTTFSKIPLPIGYYGSDNDIDSTKNNFITFTVETGDENVTDIEIAVRFNQGSVWLDYVLAVSLNKEQLGIPDNTTYDYLFYNDAIYPPLDLTEVIQLFDWCPKKAKSMCLPNGNVFAPAAITEGYPNYPIDELDVTITSENVKNVPPDTDPPSLTYQDFGNGTFLFTLAGNIPTGTYFRVIVNTPPNAGPINGIGTLSEYTSTVGQSILNVIDALFASTPVFYRTVSGADDYEVGLPVGSSIISVEVVAGSAGAGTISTEKVHMFAANYIYGLVYKDEQGRTIPGVTTFANPVDSDNDFLVTTDEFSLDSTDVETPVISASINHFPPTGAVTYAWVRRRMTYADFVWYVTCDYQDGGDGFLYFCLANIETYKARNSQFIYDTAPISSDSRIKIIAGVTGDDYNGDIWNQDYEILGTETRTLTGGSSPDDDKLFIKVKKPVASISPSYTVNMVVMVYTPMANPTDLSSSVYWEWGEEYDIYELSGVNYHRGMDQDQTASQPAEFTWAEGDVYFHQRKMFSNILTGSGSESTVNVLDSNWSDFFASAVNDNGRGIAIEVNARETYFPATIRFSREYQQNTNINQTNRFLYDNFIDLDRSFGSILKMSIKDRYIRIGQQFKIGAVPIFNQISKDAGNSVLTANTDVLLNPVQYYSGDFGVGDAPEAWTDFNFSSYFFDTNRGIWCRLSRDGITPISVLAKINSWATRYGVLRTGNYKIYGTFDSKSNRCIFAFEATGTDIARTMSFDESGNVFESPLSYAPEMMCSLGNLLITYKNGQTYTHDSATYNQFYGVDYPSYITVVFNQNGTQKKSFLAITEAGNRIWECPLVQTQVMSYGSTPQTSNLVASDFEDEEGQYNAALLNDANSVDGLINGDNLKGKYIIVKFYLSNPSSLATLEYAQLKYIESPLNSK